MSDTDRECWYCKMCGCKDSIIPVGYDSQTKQVFYSCTLEECDWYAHLLIMMNDGEFVSQTTLLTTLNKLWKEHE